MELFHQDNSYSAYSLLFYSGIHHTGMRSCMMIFITHAHNLNPNPKRKPSLGRNPNPNGNIKSLPQP